MRGVASSSTHCGFLDRCCQKRWWVLCSMYFCSCRCCYWPTLTPAESLLISSLTGFLLPEMWLLRGPRGGLEKNFSRLAIARHIFRPPHKLCYNSTTGNQRSQIETVEESFVTVKPVFSCHSDTACHQVRWNSLSQEDVTASCNIT